MASWVQIPDGSYIQISQIVHAYVDVLNPTDPTPEWVIWAGMAYGSVQSNPVILKRNNWTTKAAATTALQNAITNLGGST